MTDNLSLPVVQSSACNPMKAPLHSSLQQDVQSSHAHPAKQPHVLGTNGLRSASVDSNGRNALHCYTSSSCGTCPTIPGAHATSFESRMIFFSVPAAGVGPRTYSTGATLIPHDCCPQHYQPQHSMIESLTAAQDIHKSELLL